MYPDAGAAAQEMARLGQERYEPEPDSRGRYDEAYSRYRRLFDAVEAIT
jgi:ribulose kinase